jgi:adenylate cyclase
MIQRGTNLIPDYISDGLVEDIVRQLAGLREVSVISHGSTARFHDGEQNIDEIGRSLNVRYMVRGSIRRSGPTIRIAAELTDVATSQVIWARAYDSSFVISFDQQDEIVSQIVHTLCPRIVEAELLRIRGKRIENMSIYEKALLARSYLAKLGGENFLRAKLIMDDVIRQEPNWGEAYALAADCHGLLLAEGWSGSRDHHIVEIERLANEALSLDRDNIRALIFYGHRKTIFHRDHDTAQELFRRALEVAPGSAEAWLWSSYTYAYMGRPSDAVKRAERALHLSPSDRESYWFYIGLCIAYYTAQEYDAAVEWGHRALAEPAVGRTGRIWIAASLAGAGRLVEARDMGRWMSNNWPERRISDVVASSPYRDPEMRVRHGRHLAMAGFPE